MGLVVDPAALGGLAGLIALASWAVGRMQGGVIGTHREPASIDRLASGRASDRSSSPLAAASSPPPRPVSAGPACQQRAYQERRALLAHPVALAELHAEASAIRRDAQVFTQPAACEAPIALPSAGGERGCRYVGLSGQPTCPGGAPHACTATGACQTSQPWLVSAVQPSEPASSATRV